MYRKEQELSTRGVAKGLIHGLFEEIPGVTCLDDFLLWPPDLFALTSKILSLSGAYTNVIAPPINKPWPPINNLPFTMWKDLQLDWEKLMQYIGQEWRKGLELIPMEENYGSFDIYFDKFRNTSNKFNNNHELIELNDKGIIPKQLLYFWNKFNENIDPEINGTINDFQCIFKDECPNKPTDCHSGIIDRCPNCGLWDSFEALMSLHAIADEACTGWGIRSNKTMHIPYFPETKKGQAQFYAEQLLKEVGSLAMINTARGRVLPKRHTPNVGITLRSLSSNLAFHNSSVEVKWHTNFTMQNKLTEKFSVKTNINNSINSIAGNDNPLSVLLFPWPFEIHSNDFKKEENPNIHMNMRESDFFAYNPKTENKNFIATLESAVELAKKETNQIDLVVLPESSLNEAEVAQLEAFLKAAGIPGYITGKRGKNSKSHFLENSVQFNMVDTTGKFENSTRIEQHKHHRWKISKQQILKYNLGHILSPNKNWWEAINIKRREVNFINLGEEITICPLICEDLARQDPIADLIRTVGPSLVVTILMDGPQKLERWSAKYASVLAEDPGCAVITLTSLGMVKRYAHPHSAGSNSIGIVSDCDGKAIEIEMKEGSKGVLINLCLSPRKELLADGREDFTNTNNLIVGSLHQLVPSN